MSSRWPTVAHLLLATLTTLVGCGTSHGADDASPPNDDGGSLADASLSDAGSPQDAGRDAGAFLDASTGVDSGPDFDAGIRDVCEAEDALAAICPEILCDGLGSWQWDGERCFYTDCGACVGDDCGGPTSQAACEAEHEGCVPQACRDTGGTWRWWDEICGHYECGYEPPAVCLVGAPACDCGDGKRFEPGMGCVTTTCPDVDILPTDQLCANTGGTWTNSICCPTVCGEFCDAECLAPACVCGPMEVFHPDRGCEVGQVCMERELGQSCDGGARCEGGALCCDACGGAGCAGEPTCIAPVCDSDPDTDTCGNSATAP